MSGERLPDLRPAAHQGPEAGSRIEGGPELAPDRRVEYAPDETAMRRRRIGGVFSRLGAALLEGGIVTDSHIFLANFSHAYLRSADNPRVVLHVQGLPAQSTDGEMVVRTNLLDYDAMMRERAEAKNGGYNIMGSETIAVLDPERTDQLVPINYSADSLSELLHSRYPELGLPESPSRG